MAQNTENSADRWHCPRCGTVMARTEKPADGPIIQYTLKQSPATVSEMRSLAMVAWAVLTVLMALWLVSNYFYDEPFRNYVNIALIQYYPYAVLTIGLGGGSFLGYSLVMKKRLRLAVTSAH